MPFTFAHSAAALPFRRLCLIPSALIIGTFAPDLEYFLRFAPDDAFGHTPVGVVVLTIPLALIVLWLFHAFVKTAAARLVPGTLQRRLSPHLTEFRFGGLTRFSKIVGWLLVGIATHLLWDAFTHAHTPITRHWPYLTQRIHFPVLRAIPLYKVLQHASTVIGMVVLAIWFVFWYRNTSPSGSVASLRLSTSRKLFVVAAIAIIAVGGGVIRAFAHAHALDQKVFLGQLIVTAISLTWWQLVTYGIFRAYC